VVSLDNTFKVNLVFEHNCGHDSPDDKPMSIVRKREGEFIINNTLLLQHKVTFSKLIDIQHIKNTNAFEVREK
jgi:hypothetical protein